MPTRFKFSRAALQLMLLVPIPFLAFGSAAAQDKLKVEVVAQVGHSREVASVAFSPDGRTVLSGSWDNTLKLWDVARGKVLRTFEGHSGWVTSVAFSPDGRTVVSGSDDTTVRLWKTATGELLATLVSEKNEWLAMTPSGFFAASDGALDMLAVVRGLKAYSVSQFVEQLYHPDLVRELLKGDPELKYEDAAKRLNLQKIIDSGPPPQIELLDKETDVANSSVLISIRLFNNTGGGIGKKLIWRVNGVAEGETTAPELQNRQDADAPVVIRRGVHLDPNEENVVSITAYNSVDLFPTEPFPIKVNRFGVSAGPRPKMYVLGIAVDNYEKDSGLHSLQFAAKDVKALAEGLKIVGENGGYEKVEIQPYLIDSDAVRDKIAQAFVTLQPIVKPWDTFILILAGHGRSVAGRGYFYYPQDAKLRNGHSVLTDGINADQWREWLAMVETTRRLLIIDTCESAEAIAIERGGNSLERESAIDRIREAVGHSVVTASRQIAYEGNALGHGILSYAILEALGTSQSDGATIDIKGIDNFVYAEVPKISERLSGIKQRPYNKIVGNFLVGRPLASVLPPPPAQCSAEAVDYILVRQEMIRTRAAPDAEPVRTEQAGYKLQVADHVGSWDKVCREGVPIGYVPHDALARAH